MLKVTFFEILLFLLLAIFSIWLMFSTFTYNNGSMYIASRAWSDFASHIPLIRSFSLGENFPPEYPLFPGSPIHYHFLFYSFVGFLESIGINIAVALNTLSALGFFSLLLVIYLFSKKIFHSKFIGLLSVIFFLFNGSLGFTLFLDKHTLVPSFDGISQFVNTIVNNREFTSFGPYDGNIISAFWNLNIYTNQRHLALSFAISMLMIMFFLSPIITGKKHHPNFNILLGIILGLLFFFHLAVFMMTVIVIIALTLLFPSLLPSALITLFVGGLLSFPQYLYLQSGGSNFKLLFKPGYLVANDLTIINFLRYWFGNLGLHLIFIPLGFAIAPVRIKKIALAFLVIFLIGNLFQFSPEMAANHKFFNYFMIFGASLSALFLKSLWDKQDLLKLVVLALLFFSTFTGVIDLFPIKNDTLLKLPDYSLNQEANWIVNNTPKNSIFLNSSYLYNPASIAGRKIFFGWPYFAWSAGYDTENRGKLVISIFKATNKDALCNLLIQNNISYIEVDPNHPEDFSINQQFFQDNFLAVYKNNQANYTIYNTASGCNI